MEKQEKGNIYSNDKVVNCNYNYLLSLEHWTKIGTPPEQKQKDAVLNPPPHKKNNKKI